jgi:hypothetical protein
LATRLRGKAAGAMTTFLASAVTIDCIIEGLFQMPSEHRLAGSPQVTSRIVFPSGTGSSGWRRLKPSIQS